MQEQADEYWARLRQTEAVDDADGVEVKDVRVSEADVGVAVEVTVSEVDVGVAVEVVTVDSVDGRGLQAVRFLLVSRLAAPGETVTVVATVEMAVAVKSVTVSKTSV